MRFIFNITLVTLVILAANGTIINSVNLGASGSQGMTLNYLANPLNALLYIDFAAQVDQALAFGKTTTAICIDKQDNAVDVQVGDSGFGVMFVCFLPGGCSFAYQLSVWLFASHLSSISPPTWAAGWIL